MKAKSGARTWSGSVSNVKPVASIGSTQPVCLGVSSKRETYIGSVSYVCLSGKRSLPQLPSDEFVAEAAVGHIQQFFAVISRVVVTIGGNLQAVGLHFGSVAEVAGAGEDHCEAEAVGDFD